MAAAPVAQMETLLTCSICLETLKDARTLACFHSFCKPCLEKFVKRERERKAAEAAKIEGKENVKPTDVKEFNCPVCRCEFCLKQGEGVGEMTPNRFISNMLEVLAIQRRAKEIPCSLCEGPAVCRCTNCNEFLCSNCLTTHQNWVRFKNHTVLTMDELAIPENQAKARGKSYCRKHKNKSLKFYCETCQELICRYCMDFIHAKENHSCVLAEEVAEKEREAIKQCCGVLEESLNKGKTALEAVANIMQSLDRTAMQARTEITQQMQNDLKAITLKLQEKTVLKISEVNQKYEATIPILPLAKQKSQLEAYVEQIKGSLDLSNNLVEKGNHEEMLSSKRMIENGVEKVKNEHPRLEPLHDGIIQFKAEPIDFASVMVNMGKIVCAPVLGSSNLLSTSAILKGKREYVAQLEEWLGNKFQWRLCYRASDNGATGENFHACCDGKGPTVTLVEVDEYIFGGYTDQNWEGEGYKKSTSSFLFSLRNKDNLAPFIAPVKKQECAIYCHPYYGPVFGDGIDVILFNPCDPKSPSQTGFGSAYTPPAGYDFASERTKTLLAGSYNFSTSEVEVFY